MKQIFYYTERTDTSIPWDQERQHCCRFRTWTAFIKFCRVLATFNQMEVRACTTQGYTNSGSYIQPERIVSKIAC